MRKLHSIGLCVIFGLLGTVSAFGQNASLLGTVRDSQQAVVPGARVSLTNTDTNVELAATSDEMGSYEFPAVRPGNYSLTVEQPGFQSFVLKPLVLAVAQRARVDATLQVGALATAINVEGIATSTVQTESSALGDVVPSKAIVEVPLY